MNAPIIYTGRYSNNKSSPKHGKKIGIPYTKLLRKILFLQSAVGLFSSISTISKIALPFCVLKTTNSYKTLT